LKVPENNTTSSENILLFVFQYSTASCTTPLYRTQARYMSACQPAVSKQTSSDIVVYYSVNTHNINHKITKYFN